MDMQKTAREIGLFETAVNLVAVCDSSDVQTKVGASMPLPDANITKNIKFIAEWLVSFGKKKYLFMTPEIALIEAMAKLVDHDTEIIFIIPCDMDLETKERLKNNLPNQLKVSVLEEPFFPGNFFPGNGMIVVSGYMAGDRAMVLADTYRLIEHYNGFLGKRAFVPYCELTSAYRYDGWLEVGQKRLNISWRAEE